MVLPVFAVYLIFSFSAFNREILMLFSLAVLSTHKFRESIARETSSSFLLINAKSLISSSEISHPGRSV